MSSKLENSILQAVRQKQAIQGVCFSWTAWGEDQRLLRQYWPNLLKSLSQACSSHSQRREGTEQISSVKNWFAGCLAGLHYLRPFPNMKWIPGRVKDSDYYVNYDYEMWGKVSGAERCGYYWEAAPSPFLLRLFVCCVCSFSCICSFVTFFLLFSFDHLFVCSCGYPFIYFFACFTAYFLNRCRLPHVGISTSTDVLLQLVIIRDWT